MLYDQCTWDGCSDMALFTQLNREDITTLSTGRAEKPRASELFR